jgi:hypothetical protein
MAVCHADCLSRSYDPSTCGLSRISILSLESFLDFVSVPHYDVDWHSLCVSTQEWGDHVPSLQLDYFRSLVRERLWSECRPQVIGWMRTSDILEALMSDR